MIRNEKKTSDKTYKKSRFIKRCLNCKNKPCIDGCPLHNDIPSFIDYIKKDDLVAAVSIIDWTSPFPFVCSRVCNQKEQCEKNCTRGKNGESVAIGMLERYVCDNAYDKIPTTLNLIPHNGKSVAIIGNNLILIRVRYLLNVF